MSYNFLYNNIDIADKRQPNKTNFYENSLKEMLKNKKKENKLKKDVINTINKKPNVVTEKKYLTSLENSYKDSLVLLETIKKNTQKNIFKKYTLETNKNNIDNNKDVQNILMKKKFLITLL